MEGEGVFQLFIYFFMVRTKIYKQGKFQINNLKKLLFNVLTNTTPPFNFEERFHSNIILTHKLIYFFIAL